MSTENLTVDGYAVMWLEEVSTRAKPQTLARYRAEYRNHVAPGLGELRLADVTRHDVKRLVVAKVRDGAGRGTVGMLVRVLSMLFSSAYDEGLIAKHPAQRLRRLFPRASSGTEDVKAMTADELARFLAAMKAEPVYWMLFRTMALTGLRHGEARALQVGDVHTKKLRVEVGRTFAGGNDLSWSPKTGRSRRVEMPQALARELEPLLRWRKPEEWIFHRRGKPLRDCSARQSFRRGLCRARLPEHFTPHSLRHTYASLLIQQGVRAEYIQRQLGHASIQITVDIYGKWLELSNADELDRFMGSVTTPPDGERRLQAPASLIPFYRASGVPIKRTSCSSTDEEGNPDSDPEEPA